MDKLHKRLRIEEDNPHGGDEDHSLQNVERNHFTNTTKSSIESLFYALFCVVRKN